MKKNNVMRENLIQFIKFSFVGVSNTLVAWICYYVCLWIDEELYIVGGFIGGILSIANAFYWNDKYVFKSYKKDWRSRIKRLAKTYISYSASALLVIFLLWTEVKFLGISKVMAPPINLLITTPLNFLLNKFWTFGRG